nr:MAG TPA: Protein of unknown function (DUF1492) [Caudoviricetes sp.]
MRAKEYLQKIREGERLLRLLEAEHTQCRADIIALKGVNYDKPLVTGGGQPVDLSTAIAKLEYYAERVNRQWGAVITRREEAKALIAKVPDVRYREVLTRRYILCESWEQIACAMGYNYRWTTRLHGAALGAFEKEALKSPKKP